MTGFWLKLGMIAVFAVITVLVVAWYDGGRVTPRLIEHEVILTEAGT